LPPKPLTSRPDTANHDTTRRTQIGNFHQIRDTTFKEFTKDNDPYGEHDFGMVEYQGGKYFWKFDYYDRKMLFGSPQPSDTSLTTRVLTVFLAEEY